MIFMKTIIGNLLKEKIAVAHLEIIDDSAKHAGHAESKKSGGGHFQLLIVSKDFNGLPAQKRHRLVHEALKDKFSQGIHALSIRALTPDEYKTL